MQIAITGGSGGVGRAAVALALSQGHTVTSIDRVAAPQQDGVRAVVADLADYDALLAALDGCDALIHLAAIPAPGHHPDHVVHNNNVVSSYNALLAAANSGITRVCQASSVNAIGHSYSRAPRYDYFPIDEQHPTYNEDPYSLSKWICELQADSIVRRYEQIQIASLRFHWVVPDIAPARAAFGNEQPRPKHLWAWTSRDAAARACLRGVQAEFGGHEVFFIIAPTTVSDTPSAELAARHYPEVPLRQPLPGTTAFLSSAKAERLLGWRHDD